MAFLDNSGDIILDAVLTDTGRYRLAKGDGSFRIAKFALGDDEIDYSLYNRNDSRGSAYFDIDILSAPIFEAFTDNASGLKSKLLTIPRTDLRFLPVIKRNINSNNNSALPVFAASPTPTPVYCVASDEETQKAFTDVSSPILTGLFGSVTPADFSTRIQLHQGLDTTQISYENRIDSDLKETQYIVEIDSRLGSIVNPGGSNEAEISYIDDDQIASYYFTLNSDGQFVEEINNVSLSGGSETQQVSIAGPRGTKLSFGIKGGLELQSSTFLFEQLGSTFNSSFVINGVEANGFYYIDTNIRVTGATTGYRIDIPVRFLKKN